MYKFFSQHENIVAGMSTRDDGNMKTHGEHSTEQAIENRKQFCEKNNINYDQIVSACVEHTINVAVVNSQSEVFINNTDALVTNEKDVYLAITSADCFPVLMYDNENDVIGIAHAGWRGIVKGIVPETLKVMVGEGAQLINVMMAFWVWMLVDVVRNEHDNDLLVWVIILIFGNVINWCSCLLFCKKEKT